MKVKDLVALLQKRDPESNACVMLGPDSEPYCVDIAGLEEFDDVELEDEFSEPVPCKSLAIRAYAITKGYPVKDLDSAMKVKDLIALLQKRDPESYTCVMLGRNSSPYCVDIESVDEFDDVALEAENSDPAPCKSVAIRAYEITKNRSVKDL